MTEDAPSSATAGARGWLPVSRSLQLMGVALFLLVVGFIAYRVLDVRAVILADADRQMSRLDMVFAEQTGRAIETIDTIMTAVSDMAVAQDPQLSAETMRRRMMGVHQVLAVVVADAQGQIILSSRDGPKTLPAAGMTLLEQLRRNANAGLLISEPIREEGGRWTALMMRRLPGEVFTGVVAGYINLAYFEEFYKAVDLTENGAIVLHRRDGTVLARYPYDEKVVGTSFADLPPFRDVLSKDIAGTVEMVSPVDGSLRILAIRALRAFPLAVNISVDASRVLDSWRRQAVTFGLAVSTAGLLIAALLFMLARRSREVEALLVSHGTAREAAEAAHRDLMVQMQERERAEAALQQAQRAEAVGQLTGGVAHDFNNLLTVILGNLELVQSMPQAAPFATRLAAIRGAAERGANLTGQLLAFARRQPLMPRAVDLAALITAMRPLLESAVGSRVALHFALDAKVGPARVDPTQIEMVILNLAINARDAMPQGGALHFATSLVELPHSDRPDAPAEGCYVSVSVRDTGTGMRPEVLARAFEPFFTTKGPGAGSGLGLSQVYGVARQSGGTARIDSTIGLGTTVEVLLPCATAADGLAQVTPAPEGAVLSDEITVLVVDDDADVLATTAMLLRRQGYRVIEASDARLALEALDRHPEIALLLTDVVMPDINGPELSRRALLLRPNLPVVFFSGYADPEAIAGAAPMARLLRKPFRPAELQAIIAAALADPKE